MEWLGRVLCALGFHAECRPWDGYPPPRRIVRRPDGWIEEQAQRCPRRCGQWRTIAYISPDFTPGGKPTEHGIKVYV